MRILCVCENGESRSRLLAACLAGLGHDTAYAGSRPGASNPVKQEQLDRADLVVALSPKAERLLRERFSVGEIETLDVTFSAFEDKMRDEISQQIVRLRL